MHDWATISYDATSAAMLVTGSLPADRVVAEAAGFAGARIVARADWASAGAALHRAGAIDMLLVEAAGVSDAELEATLPLIEHHARERAIPVVATFEERQIDLVAAELSGRNVQLLCTPSTADRVAALTLARNVRIDRHVSDPEGDFETGRLRRLNEEVARIAETLARLTRDTGVPERPVPSVGDRTNGYGAPPPAGDTVSANDLRQAIRARRLRSQFFEATLFEDPAWDMLLDLYAAELERAQVSVSSLCIAAAVAPTTALRWIAKMTDAGLLVRHPDPFDRRRAFMALSDVARDGLRGYFAAARRAGLAIA